MNNPTLVVKGNAQIPGGEYEIVSGPYASRKSAQAHVMPPCAVTKQGEGVYYVINLHSRLPIPSKPKPLTLGEAKETERLLDSWLSGKPLPDDKRMRLEELRKKTKKVAGSHEDLDIVRFANFPRPLIGRQNKETAAGLPPVAPQGEPTDRPDWFPAEIKGQPVHVGPAPTMYSTHESYQSVRIQTDLFDAFEALNSVREIVWTHPVLKQPSRLTVRVVLAYDLQTFVDEAADAGIDLELL